MASNMSNNSLKLLCDYSSGSSDEEAIPGPRVSTKRGTPKDWSEDSTKKKLRLPVPSALTSLFLDSSIEARTLDDPSQHDGRIRSFQHERGNWATFVYIPYEWDNPEFQSLVGTIIKECERTVPLKKIEEPHISLTKTVVLRHHWIDSFILSVREAVVNVPAFTLTFNCFEIYCNEERTRTFVGLKLDEVKVPLHLIKLLDKCLAEFRLPQFYENPSFHLSIAWCVGDYSEQLRSYLPKLQPVLSQSMLNHPNIFLFGVQQLLCKTGNKHFTFCLD